ncbi:HTH-type transcriptional activator mta [Corynebacterium atrinae]|nr:MerR family transcriptional regulator [Corynebacterium atrinae]WJY64167.1 HTH-type transcriptional activator mta [Corynebacterium atrinae]
MAQTEGSKVGEVAAQTGLSIRALRHYDEVGVITPSGHTPGGFRLYSQADIDRLLLVDQMKSLGFALDDIREFLRALDTLAASAGGGGAGRAREVLASFRRQACLRLEEMRCQVARSEDFLTQLDELAAP